MTTKDEAMTRTISPVEHLTGAIRQAIALLERFPVPSASPGYNGAEGHDDITAAHHTLHFALRELKFNQGYVDAWHHVADLEQAADDWYKEHGWEAGPDPYVMERGAAALDAMDWYEVEYDEGMERYKALLAAGYRPSEE